MCSEPVLEARDSRLRRPQTQSLRRPPRQPNPSQCTSVAISMAKCSKENPSLAKVPTQSHQQPKKAPRDAARPELSSLYRHLEILLADSFSSFVTCQLSEHYISNRSFSAQSDFCFCCNIALICFAITTGVISFGYIGFNLWFQTCFS